LNEIHCQELLPSEWERLRDIRLRSLQESPEAFGSTFEVLNSYTHEQWQEMFRNLTWLVSNLEGYDIALMSIENLTGDFGSTCWIGSCWSDPMFRRRGALRSLFEYLDQNAQIRGWQVPGLGVFVENQGAMQAYQRLGFEPIGQPMPSTRKPEKMYQRMLRGGARA
jgi:RimJ/RimL family protein N-acetyltransferase